MAKDDGELAAVVAHLVIVDAEIQLTIKGCSDVRYVADGERRRVADLADQRAGKILRQRCTVGVTLTQRACGVRNVVRIVRQLNATACVEGDAIAFTNEEWRRYPRRITGHAHAAGRQRII